MPQPASQLSNRETTGSSSLFHHRWSWTVIKSRPEEHLNTKSGGGGDQAWGKEKRGNWYYGTQKFAPRRSELQLTVDFNDSSKQLRQIELPRAVDSLHRLPMSEGDDCLRAKRGEKRKGCRWRLKPIFPCKIVEFLDASLIANSARIYFLIHNNRF